jgi:hypothetical protein
MQGLLHHNPASFMAASVAAFITVAPGAPFGYFAINGTRFFVALIFLRSKAARGAAILGRDFDFAGSNLNTWPTFL